MDITSRISKLETDNRKNYILKFAVLGDTNLPYSNIVMRLMQPADGRYLIVCQNGGTGGLSSCVVVVKVFWLYWN